MDLVLVSSLSWFVATSSRTLTPFSKTTLIGLTSFTESNGLYQDLTPTSEVKINEPSSIINTLKKRLGRFCFNGINYRLNSKLY